MFWGRATACGRILSTTHAHHGTRPYLSNNQRFHQATNRKNVCKAGRYQDGWQASGPASAALISDVGGGELCELGGLSVRSPTCFVPGDASPDIVHNLLQHFTSAKATDVPSWSICDLAAVLLDIEVVCHHQRVSAVSSPDLKQFLQKTEVVVIQQPHVFAQPTPTADIVWVYARLKYSPSQQFIASLTSSFQECTVALTHEWITPRHLSLMAWALAKATQASSADFQQLILAHSLPIMHQFHAPDLARTIWAAATASIQPSIQFMAVFLAEAHRKLPCFQAKELSMLMWSLATLRCQPPPHWLEHFCRAASSHLPSMKPQELANVMWGLAVLSPPRAIPESLLSSIVEHSKASLHKLGPLDIMQVLWAAGRMHSRGSCASQYQFDAVWVQALLEHMVALLEAPKPISHDTPGGSQAANRQHQPVGPSQTQHSQPGHLVAVTLVSLVRLHYRPQPSCLQSLLRASIPALPMFSIDELSNTLWALAHLRYRPCKPWLHSVLSVVQERLLSFRPAHLGKVIWSLGRLGVTFPKILSSALLACSDARMGSCQPCDLAAILWGLALCNILPPQSWRSKWLTQVQSRAEHFHARDLAIALKAAAAQKMAPSPAWMECMTEQMVKVLPWFSTTQLTQTLQALELLHMACHRKLNRRAGSRSAVEYEPGMADQLWKLRGQQKRMAAQKEPEPAEGLGQRVSSYFQPDGSLGPNPDVPAQIVVMGLQQQKIVESMLSTIDWS